MPTLPETIRANPAGTRSQSQATAPAAVAEWELAGEVTQGGGDPGDLTDQSKKLHSTTLATEAPLATATTAPSTSPEPVSGPAAITRPSPAPAAQAGQTCESVIAAVEARGLFPAPGFVVICPGDAMGHAGMTCLNVASVCPGKAEIIIHLVQAYVVSNEFENSRILSGTPARCHEIDCGHVAYGF